MLIPKTQVWKQKLKIAWDTDMELIAVTLSLQNCYTNSII